MPYLAYLKVVRVHPKNFKVYVIRYKLYKNETIISTYKHCYLQAIVQMSILLQCLRPTSRKCLSYFYLDYLKKCNVSWRLKSLENLFTYNNSNIIWKDSQFIRLFESKVLIGSWITYILTRFDTINFFRVYELKTSK